MKEIIKTPSSLQLNTIGQLVVLTKGQKALLKVIKDCVATQKVLDWDTIVRVYYLNIRATHINWKYNYSSKHYDILEEIDIWKSYIARDTYWTYGLRASIKAWFLSNIGILVVKNQLIVIPVINTEEKLQLEKTNDTTL